MQIVRKATGKSNRALEKRTTQNYGQHFRYYHSNSETQYAVVRQVAKKLKWVPITDPVANMNFDICWTDAHVKQEIFYKMSQGQKINHFPGMEILSRKNNLGKSLMAFREQFPEEYDFFPNTWMLPSEFQELK